MDAQVLAGLDPPRRSLRAGVGEHTLPEPPDETRLFGDGNELRGPELAALGMLPAHEGLEARQPAAPRLHDRLVEHAELAPIERPFELTLRAQAAFGQDTHLRLEDQDSVTARPFGGTEGDARVAKHVQRAFPVGMAARHPDARGEGEPLPGHGEGRPEDGLETARHPHRVLDRAHALEQERELVGPDPGQGFVRPHAVPKAMGHEPQQLVTGAETQRFVDPPEAVEAHDEGREALTARAFTGLGRLGPVE